MAGRYGAVFGAVYKILEEKFPADNRLFTLSGFVFDSERFKVFALLASLQLPQRKTVIKVLFLLFFLVWLIKLNLLNLTALNLWLFWYDV